MSVGGGGSSNCSSAGGGGNSNSCGGISGGAGGSGDDGNTSHNIVDKTIKQKKVCFICGSYTTFTINIYEPRSGPNIVDVINEKFKVQVRKKYEISLSLNTYISFYIFLFIQFLSRQT